MKDNYKLGALLSIVGILAGILTLYFLSDTYNTVIHTHFNAGQWEESNTVRFVYAVLGWLGTAAGALSAAVLWGFLKKQDWAWFWGAIAATILLLTGFFPMIPAADSGLPTPTLWVFLLAAVMWFGMLLIGGVDKKVVGLTFTAGLAYVLTFIFAALKRKSWAVPVGIFAGVMSMIGGYPMGIHNVFEVQHFSMFLPAPIISTILVIIICLPGTQKLITTE